MDATIEDDLKMILETTGVIIVGVCILASVVIQLHWFPPPTVLTEAGQQNEREHYNEKITTSPSLQSDQKKKKKKKKEEKLKGTKNL